MITEGPVPLREALAEAIITYAKSMEALVGRASHVDKATADAALAALGRIAALIEQIPIVVEVKEGPS